MIKPIKLFIMELILNSKPFTPARVEKNQPILKETHGLLNSNYQNVVKETIKTRSTDSIFNKKRSINCARFDLVSSVEILLKLSIFTAVILGVFH